MIPSVNSHVIILLFTCGEWGGGGGRQAKNKVKPTRFDIKW